MATKLEAHEQQIGKVLCSDYDFYIPAYQRPYAWETTQTLELLDDLTLALDDRTEEPYFLGSIVLVKTHDLAGSDVIDGQQRLTTITILLAVLRELSSHADVSQELHHRIMEPGNILQDIKPKPRLTLRDRDRKFFREYVQDVGGIGNLLSTPGPILQTDAQSAIRGNTEVLYERLSSWPEDRRVELAKFVDKWTYLVVVTTPDETSAHRIFAVMNDRGLDLRPTDVFKADIIGALPEARQDDYTSRWEDAEQELGRESFSMLFSHLRTLFVRQRATRELLRELRDEVLAQYKGREAEFVDTVLEPYADAFSVIISRNYQAPAGAEQVNRWLQRLSQLDNLDWQPPALWAFRHHSNDPQLLANFLQQLERLAGSMLIRRLTPSERQNRYGSVLRALAVGAEMEPFWLDDYEQEETIRALGGEIYRHARVRKYVLLRLDEVLAGLPGVSYDHKVITVEHVLPQNPARDSEWLRVFSDRDRQFWTHRLANLVLLNRAKNAQAQNYDFETKKGKYFTDKKGVVAFALTSQVNAQQRWNPALLEQRQQQLVSLLAQTWDLTD